MDKSNGEKGKQLLDLICDEVNVKYIVLSAYSTEKGRVAYCRKTRKFVLEAEILN